MKIMIKIKLHVIQSNLKQKNLFSKLISSLIVCVNCHHGGHFGHLKEWFDRNISCAVSTCDCDCKCA